MDEITITIPKNIAELQGAFNLRYAQYVKRNNISPEQEFDENDFAGTTIIAKNKENKIIGTMRARYFKDRVKLERICVAPEYQKHGIAKKMFFWSVCLFAQKGFSEIIGYARTVHFKSFEKWGIKRVGTDIININGLECCPFRFKIPTQNNYKFKKYLLNEVDLVSQKKFKINKDEHIR